jgi:hypothetical protein
MDVFRELKETLQHNGAEAAISRLCGMLLERKDYGGLFYARLLAQRWRMGLSPIPTGRNEDIPDSLRDGYETAIREAARDVGRLCLAHGDIARAWPYFRMIDEPGPVAQAIEAYSSTDRDDIQRVAEIAFHEDVHAGKGFDLILNAFGVCAAITALTSRARRLDQETERYCIGRLVSALYEELSFGLRRAIVEHDGAEPPETDIASLVAERRWLFDDESFHVELSHLASVVQISIHLGPGSELNRARQLCAYGARLPPDLLCEGASPFEDLYGDIGKYLAVVAGEDVEEGLAHFRRKIGEASEGDSRPAETLVNLLLQLGRPQEALNVARSHLAEKAPGSLSCPGVVELCRQVEDYEALEEVARATNDTVHYVAAIVGAASKRRVSNRPSH